MKMMISLGLCLIALLAPGPLSGQAGVRVESHEDAMDSWTYAYARADRGPLRSIDDRGIVFDRAPHLIFVCAEATVDVVYMFDTELVGEGGTVLVQSRFDARPASKSAPWPVVVDPSMQAEIDAAVAAMGVDENNPLLEMFGMSSTAAMLSGESAEVFLAEAGNAERATMRVTDQLDGETHTDIFDLDGFGDAIQQIRASCGG